MLFDEYPQYEPSETWKKISIHDDKNVRGFFGPYRFLSNFWVAPVAYEGRLYPSAENAYQAAKVVKDQKDLFTGCDPKTSKKLWKNLSLSDSCAKKWDDRKYQVMQDILIIKFQDPELRDLLDQTGDRYLEETNWWKDVYWGFDYNLQKGENNLGKLLMEIRGR